MIKLKNKLGLIKILHLKDEINIKLTNEEVKYLYEKYILHGIVGALSVLYQEKGEKNENRKI